MDPVLLAKFVEEGRDAQLRPLHGRRPFPSLADQHPSSESGCLVQLHHGHGSGQAHGIFDFIHRDPDTLSPYLSTSRSEEGAYALSLGSWRECRSRAGRVTLLRKGSAFWEILGRHGTPSTILRAPANFPPGPASPPASSPGMGTPDLQGTYGTFSFYTQDPDPSLRQRSPEVRSFL